MKKDYEVVAIIMTLPVLFIVKEILVDLFENFWHIVLGIIGMIISLCIGGLLAVGWEKLNFFGVDEKKWLWVLMLLPTGACILAFIYLIITKSNQ